MGKINFTLISAGLLLISSLTAQATFAATSSVNIKREVAAEEDEEDDGSGPLQELEEPEENPAKRAQPIQSEITPAPEAPRASSASGEKVFDWQKHKGEAQVPHPFAEKGLIRITKDQTYIYKVRESDQRRAASFRVGMFEPTELENPEEAGLIGSTFEENYDNSSNPAILFDYEWQLWASPIGKFGIKAGSGIYVAQGNGHFTGADNEGETPRENFTFIAFPTSLGAIYRAQMRDKQLFVPYADGGITAWGFTELRDDDKGTKFGGALAAYFAGGMAINLTYFDTFSMLQMDREYGINAVYLTLEYRNMVALSDKYDFSGDLLNAGFLMEF